MKHDVFISYSRKDIDAANALCDLLNSAGVDYWIDRNIHGSANFLTEITQNLRNCTVLIFVASANSALSPWTQKEILFALKHHKVIIPYRIGDFCFEDNDELDFVFTNVQWIASEQEVIAALDKLGCCCKAEKGTTIKTTTSTVACTPAKTYNVGDYYNDGVREGVVFEVDQDGLHGKIVSMIQSDEQLTWSSDEEEQKRLIGADSKTDGEYNMAKVTTIPDWRCKYQAFKWCADLGEGWYLPSIEELLTIYRNKNRLKLLRLTGYYWSSTEGKYQFSSGAFSAWSLGVYEGDTYHNAKFAYISVRAVSVF